MRITEKGQVTIPQDIRERAGLMPGTDVEFVEMDGVVTLQKAQGKSRKPTRGDEIVARVRGSATLQDMTTDQIMELMRGPRDDIDRLKRPSGRGKERSGVAGVVRRTPR